MPDFFLRGNEFKTDFDNSTLNVRLQLPNTISAVFKCNNIGGGRNVNRCRRLGSFHRRGDFDNFLNIRVGIVNFFFFKGFNFAIGAGRDKREFLEKIAAIVDRFFRLALSVDFFRTFNHCLGKKRNVAFVVGYIGSNQSFFFPSVKCHRRDAAKFCGLT